MKRDVIGISLAMVSALGSMAFLHAQEVTGLVAWLVGWALLVLRMVTTAVRQRSVAKRLGTYITARMILTMGVAAPLVDGTLRGTWPGWLAVLVVIAITSGEARLALVARRSGIRVADVGSLYVPRVSLVPASVMIVCQLLTLPTLLLLGYADVPTPYWMVAILPTVTATVVVAAKALARRSLVRTVRDALPEAMTDLGPRFAVYWDAPGGSGYQLAMWMPYFRRIGVPFVVLVRNPATFNEALRVADGAPVVLIRTMADLERCVVPSLDVAFYVNNAARNAHLVRYTELTHVQLLHGDSDKAPSRNPVTAMFDKVFVAGQAGIDRYAAHGVHIPAHKFVIVGRPQVADIELRGAERTPDAATTVLYAPTWRGQHADAAYSSLDHGLELVEMLLARGCAVLFRPHPYSHRDREHRELIKRINARLESDTGRARDRHRFGEAMAELSLTECFNTSDAMVADVSSVIVDYLQSEKPIAIVRGDAEPEEFLSQFPAAAAAYLLDADPAHWPTVLDEMFGPDPLADDRVRMRKFYLGDLDRSAYDEVFVAAARSLLSPDPHTADPHTAAPHNAADSDDEVEAVG